MVIANSLNLQNTLDPSNKVLKDNVDYLTLYDEVNVPHIEMERIVSVLFTRGRTSIVKLIDQLARNEYDYYLQRRYVYTLMNSNILEFNVFEPISNETIVWVENEIISI